eukprot:scaffold5393_cov99-Skeletonema_marinoi.AAC.5
MTGTNGNGNGAKIGTDKVKQGLAQMLKGGVITQDVSTAKRRRKICNVDKHPSIWKQVGLSRVTQMNAEWRNETIH